MQVLTEEGCVEVVGLDGSPSLRLASGEHGLRGSHIVRRDQRGQLVLGVGSNREEVGARQRARRQHVRHGTSNQTQNSINNNTSNQPTDNNNKLIDVIQ